MIIDCDSKTVKQVLTQSHFKIPSFQRPYSWDADNVEEFWADAIADRGGEYFIGSVVVYKIDDDHLGLVDGQQRFTTITMILAALTHALDNQGHGGLADQLHRFIERSNINDADEFVVQTESSHPYFQQAVQTRTPQPSSGKLKRGSEEQMIKRAYDYVATKISDEVESVELQGTISRGDKPELIKSRLLEIRDRVLSLKLIFVEVDSEDDAHTIFETLNTRGKELSVADLVKNHVYRLSPAKNKQLDRAKDKWEELQATFSGSQANIDVAGFLHHYWLSRYEWLGKNKLFAGIRREIKKSNVTGFLDDLLLSSISYRTLAEPGVRPWRADELPLRRSIEAMNWFRMRQTLPIMLCGLDLYERGKLKLSNFKRLLETLEHFHFHFTAVTSQTPSGGTARMYAMYARRLNEAGDEQGRRRVIDELRKKLADKVPTEAEFIPHFKELRFTKKVTQHRDVLKYALFKALIEPSGNGSVVDITRLSIEHLEPEAGGEPWAGSIGNLLLVPADLNNNDLGSKDFAGKKKVLVGKVPDWVDECITDASNWGEAEVTARAEWLAKQSYALTSL